MSVDRRSKNYKNNADGRSWRRVFIFSLEYFYGARFDLSED